MIVKITITTMSLTMVVPRITSVSGPWAPMSSITATVRSGDELAAHTPSSKAIPSTPAVPKPAMNGRRGRATTSNAATPTATMTVTMSVVLTMAALASPSLRT